MKKLIILLAVFSLAVPLAAGAQLVKERPDFTTCQLKHDLSGLFGAGYGKGAIVSAEKDITGLDVSGLPKTTVLLTKDQIETKAGIDVIPWIGPSYGFIFDQMEKVAKLSDTDIWDGNKKIGDDMTVEEYNKIQAGREGLVAALKSLPVVGEGAAGVVDTTFGWIIENAAAGVQIKGAAEYASVACLIDKIEVAEDWFFVLLIVLAGFLILLGAFTFLTAAGEPDKIKKARDYILWAAVGLAIAFLAKGLVRVITQLMA